MFQYNVLQKTTNFVNVCVSVYVDNNNNNYYYSVHCKMIKFYIIKHTLLL